MFFSSGKFLVLFLLFLFVCLLFRTFWMDSSMYIYFFKCLPLIFKNSVKRYPDQCGSVGWASSRKAKAAGLFPGQGTRLCRGFRPQSPVGERRRGHRAMSHTSMFLSLPSSLPLSLKRNKNKIFLKIKKNKKSLRDLQQFLSI